MTKNVFRIDSYNLSFIKRQFIPIASLSKLHPNRYPKLWLHLCIEVERELVQVLRLVDSLTLVLNLEVLAQSVEELL